MRARDFLPERVKTELSTELANTIRQAVAAAGQEKVIVIGQINIQLNMAQGGGATVEVRNK